MDETCKDELRTYIERKLRSGFEPPHEIVEDALEYLSEEHALEGAEPVAQKLLEEEVAKLEAESKLWPRPTDNDRLERAFEALQAAGIVARHHWTCCQSCGHSEIGGEIAAEEVRGAQVRGYTFYHQQDTDSAMAGHGLFLAYGAMEEGGTTSVGEEIRGALQAQGLKVEWNGSSSSRLRVTMEWRASLCED